MGLVCSLVFQPVIRLIQTIAAIIEYILVQICRWITEAVSILKQVLRFICNTVVRTVCGAVCGLICGICDFFCGIFGCDCGCRNVCNNVCNVITDIVCGWVYVLETVLDYITRFVCSYILQALIRLIHVIVAFVTMVLTWVCSLVDLFIRWLLCWTYVAELWDKLFRDKRPRRFRVAPKIVCNNAGHSDWFVYINNTDASGNVDQNAMVYILSDEGRPLVPVVERRFGAVTYYEVLTRGNFITGTLRRRDGALVPGRPFYYYANKVMEISSHLFGDLFASGPADDGTGTTPERNLLTYRPNVQAWLNAAGQLAANVYNTWASKYTTPAAGDYFGDGTIADMGVRVDKDSTCSHPTNTFLHLVHSIQLPHPNTSIAENMTCGAGQTLAFDDTNYLMVNKTDANSVTTYFVSRYNVDESSVGCNDLLGYTTVTFQDSNGPIFIGSRVFAFEADTNRMMSRIVGDLSGMRSQLVRVAETYVHELGHQSGLLHQTDAPACQDATALHIAKIMNPDASVRRAFSRLEWCMVRSTWYVTGSSIEAFLQAAELPDSGSRPDP